MFSLEYNADKDSLKTTYVSSGLDFVTRQVLLGLFEHVGATLNAPLSSENSFCSISEPIGDRRTANLQFD